MSRPLCDDREASVANSSQTRRMSRMDESTRVRAGHASGTTPGRLAAGADLSTRRPASENTRKRRWSSCWQ